VDEPDIAAEVWRWRRVGAAPALDAMVKAALPAPLLLGCSNFSLLIYDSSADLFVLTD
jgi:hypothetical protein